MPRPSHVPKRAPFNVPCAKGRHAEPARPSPARAMRAYSAGGGIRPGNSLTHEGVPTPRCSGCRRCCPGLPWAQKICCPAWPPAGLLLSRPPPFHCSTRRTIARPPYGSKKIPTPRVRNTVQGVQCQRFSGTWASSEFRRRGIRFAIPNMQSSAVWRMAAKPAQLPAGEVASDLRRQSTSPLD
jgi:hypothetical protein